MNLNQEVYLFSGDYINRQEERTKERTDKIRLAYHALTGEYLRNSCSTCLIEALFIIRKIMEQKTSKYELKPGAVLEAFSDPSKVMTRLNTTDELAEWHLKHNPGVIKFFSRVPTENIVEVPGTNRTAQPGSDNESVSQAEKNAAVDAERKEKAEELEAERALKTNELETEREAKAKELESERVLKEKQIAEKAKTATAKAPSPKPKK
jgi:hypothetical protein